MTVLAFPASVRPVRQRWQLLGNTQASSSPLNAVVQTYEQPGALWIAELAFESLTRAEIAEFEAFLFELGGRAGRFTLWDHARETPRGAGGGTPLVNGAGQTGVALNVDGAPVSTNGWLLKGDYIGVNGELKVLTANVNTTGGGAATLAFRPALRYAPADNAAVTLTKPVATFMLADDEQVQFDRRKVLSSITIRCVEAIA